ncbi:ATP-binding protein [Roseiconus lacunae]|uniref:ATP-binding protein n=1 Tax=Roseiconus lacunae TaxID=2605694 RepID=UPI0011F307A5
MSDRPPASSFATMPRQHNPPSELSPLDPPSPISADASNKERPHSQSLRSKIVLALALMLGVVVGIEEFVRQYVIANEFAALERVTALKETNRVLSAINTEIDFLADTAVRDVTFLAYAENPNENAVRYETLNQSDETERRTARVHWRARVDGKGNWHWLTPPSLPAEVVDQIGARLQNHNWTKNPAATGITTDQQVNLMLFAGVRLPDNAVNVQPIVAGDDDDEFDRHGYYVIGRALDQTLVADLQRRTSVPFTISRLHTETAHDGKLQIRAVNQSMLAVHSPLLNPEGETLAELLVSLPRDVMMRSKRTTAIARYLSLCGVCGSLLILFLLLQRLVIGRLESIRQHTEQIAQSGLIVNDSDDSPLEVAGNDEISQLADSFSRMRERLGDAQSQLTDASHAAGMSLVANTVIHNVGNVLTNVNSLMETATQRVNALRVEPLEKLAQRLGDDDLDEAFRQATPNYLHRLSETLEDDKRDLTDLLYTLNDNIQHIHQVIRDQRKHTSQSLQWSRLSLPKLIRESINCAEAKLREDQVRVEFEYDSNLPIWTDRSLLLQVLINVITNAGSACHEFTQSDQTPTLKVDIIKTKSAARVRFRDNGCGMDKATLSRVFAAHFTTRSSGSGLGLHFCANAMKRLGGAIHAESLGRHQGSTFIIEIPLTRPGLHGSGETEAVASESSTAINLTPDDTVDLTPVTETDDREEFTS